MDPTAAWDIPLALPATLAGAWLRSPSAAVSRW
jgi:hypothetical protein